MKRLVLIAALVALSFTTHAKKLAGLIIANGKTREVTFDITVPWLDDEPNFVRLQYKVKYYDENGKKQTLRPEDAEEIQFDYDGMVVRMVSCPDAFGGNLFSSSSKIFLKLEIDGRLKLYRYYYKQSAPVSYGAPGMSTTMAPAYTVDNLIFQKGNGPLKRPRSLGWKKDMLEYFSDCPALRDRIEGKVLKRDDIEAIVMYYNNNCGKR
jgi:hypothetical protein